MPAAAASPSGVSIEYQRQQAKAMRQYFQNMKMSETVEKAKVFGWTSKNEITNGRWVMMGFFIGLMTEYATGVSFIDQLKLMASYLGLVDLE
ncbi:low CO2 and stress-induced one-helix [Micractinium conductrix]|uniref:Low CO2 and stress-induced one-helix n=1 Tax=Micractinium conductrix TaxID=554055 RepID=A0A2P6VAW6_9CHLO|nr:low CO2 and stress-induced one-helix [Micractinium conductrix]|eukprot:PSC71191.1 low CO2 and stress-induced one-helix [Micractinium conductrix]